MPNSFADELDKQENWYDRRTGMNCTSDNSDNRLRRNIIEKIAVMVETGSGEVACRTYQMRDADGNESKPSPHYKLVGSPLLYLRRDPMLFSLRKIQPSKVEQYICR